MKKLGKLLNKQNIIRIILLSSVLLLSGCSVWKDDFETKPVKGMPKASIHELSTMVDKGIIKEDDIQGDVSTIKLNSGKEEHSGTEHSGTFFTDGNVSRGYEEVHRIYLASYEDENKNLHGAHNLYVVVRPAIWQFHKGEK